MKCHGNRASRGSGSGLRIPTLSPQDAKNANQRRTSFRHCTLTVVDLADRLGPSALKIIPHCMVINARSLAKPDAASALHAELHSNKIDICFVSEMWLNNRIPSHSVCPNGYILLRKDRPGTRNGGEVAAICRSDWQIKRLFASDSFECVWSIITTSNSKYFVAAVYPDPFYADGHFLDYLSNCCDQVLSSDPDARIVSAGDINQLDINTLISQHNFPQLVKSFTRGQKILDVFLTNCPHLWKQPSVFKSLVRSDHLSVLVMPRIALLLWSKNKSD